MTDRFSDESQKKVTDEIFIRFLLARLLMDSFLDKLTVREMKFALCNLPQGSDAYDEAYDAAMKRICAQGKGSSEMTKKILAWILCAKRPLSTLELLHALAVEPGDNEVDEDNMLEAEQILTICAGLVTIDEQSDSVRFIHYTTQEYLQRNQRTWLPLANAEIARSCTSYLSIDGLLLDPCTSEKDYESRLKDFVLLKYAAVYWGPHMNLLMGTYRFDKLSEVGNEALSLLLDTKRLSVMSQVLFMSERTFFSSTTLRAGGGGFSCGHWIGRFGLLPLLEQWIDRKYEIDQRDDSGRTPLWWAAKNGHEAIVKRLLDTGKVEVDSKDTRNGRTPLSRAAENGHEAVVKLLLETGKVEIDSKDIWDPLSPPPLRTRDGLPPLSREAHGMTPLSWAAARGHEAVVKLLLETGKVEVDSKDTKYGQTPLSRAAENGHEAVVKLLLDTGKVEVDSKDKDGRTPLSWAADGRTDGRTARLRAAVRGHEAVVKLLLETGKVEADSKDKYGRTPLSWAAVRGHEVVVKLLLETGKVEVDSKDKDGRTPLSRAAETGHEATVKQLLDTNTRRQRH
jgi:ankyrin repeat protein